MGKIEDVGFCFTFPVSTASQRSSSFAILPHPRRIPFRCLIIPESKKVPIYCWVERVFSCRMAKPTFRPMYLKSLNIMPDILELSVQTKIRLLGGTKSDQGLRCYTTEMTNGLVQHITVAVSISIQWIKDSYAYYFRCYPILKEPSDQDLRFVPFHLQLLDAYCFRLGRL